MLLAFLMVPLIQREIDVFKETIWNTHRIRTLSPSAFMIMISCFLSWIVSEEELQQVAINSGVLEVETDYLDKDFRTECERVLPYPSKVEPKECRAAFFVSERELSFLIIISLMINFCCNFVILWLHCGNNFSGTKLA